MAVYATVADVQAAYDGQVPGDQIGWVQNRLDHAERLVAMEAGDLAARITNGLTTADAIRAVLVEMVVRVLRNPQGYREEVAGPFSYRLDAALATGQLYLSREDRRLLGLRRGALTVALDDPALPWVHYSGGRTTPELPLP